jgi:hypothetical protein
MAMAKKKPGPRPSPGGRRKVVLALKGTDAWREWFEGFCRYMRAPGATVADQAIAKYAKESGYSEEPPGR